MSKRANHKRAMAAIVSLALLLAALFAGAAMLERTQQRGRERALEAESAGLRESAWTDENTIAIDGRRYGFDHRIETFLFIGTDDSGSSAPENYRGEMADFLLLMVLDHTDDTIGFLQIDRNTITDVRELDMEGQEITSRRLQICTAHWYGRSPEMAAENTVEAVSRYLGGITIDGYYEMNMRDIGQLNHAVGGVKVTIEDDLDQEDPALSRGSTVVLDDDQAAFFLRARRYVGEGRNTERMARQRQYMASFFDTIREHTMENPKYGLELWSTLRGFAVTNMNGNDFSRIAQKLLKGERRGIRLVKGETILGDVLQDGVKHEEFYPDMASVRDEMIALYGMTPVEA